MPVDVIKCITVELEVLPEVGVHRSSPALPLDHLTVLLVIPALRFIKGHEKQHELPHLWYLVSQGSLPTHQQGADQTRVDVFFLNDEAKIESSKTLSTC